MHGYEAIEDCWHYWGETHLRMRGFFARKLNLCCDGGVQECEIPSSPCLTMGLPEVDSEADSSTSLFGRWSRKGSPELRQVREGCQSKECYEVSCPCAQLELNPVENWNKQYRTHLSIMSCKCRRSWDWRLLLRERVVLILQSVQP